jgi:tetratricopeptide (TPR) repeat protein
MNKRLEQLKALASERPNDAFTLFALAKEYQKSENFKQSLLYYREIVKIQPDYVGTYYHLGKLLEQENQEKEALEIYRKGIEIAQKIQDLHALSELKNAHLNLEIEMDL